MPDLRAVAISGSPRTPSKSKALVELMLDALARRGCATQLIDLATLPADALLARCEDASVSKAIADVGAAQIVIAATPTYRALYAGLLKCFFDLMPQGHLAGKICVALQTGAVPHHALSPEYGLRPLFMSLDGIPLAGIYATDAEFIDGAPNTELSAKAASVAESAAGLAGRQATAHRKRTPLRGAELSKQRYVSNELTHFVGRRLPAEEERYQLLVGILSSGWLLHPPFNPNISGNLSVDPTAQLSRNEMYAPEIICFCDIPHGDLDIHMRKYGRFGLAFSKRFLITRGASPVMYVAKNSAVDALSSTQDILEAVERFRAAGPGAELHLPTVMRSEHFDSMIREYHDLFGFLRELIQKQPGQPPGVSGDFKRLIEVGRFLDFHLFSFIVFFDDGKADDDPENFYMEREWRKLGNLKFGVADVERVLLPRSFADRFRNDVPDYRGQLSFVDPPVP